MFRASNGMTIATFDVRMGRGLRSRPIPVWRARRKGGRADFCIGRASGLAVATSTGATLTARPGQTACRIGGRIRTEAEIDDLTCLALDALAAAAEFPEITLAAIDRPPFRTASRWARPELAPGIVGWADAILEARARCIGRRRGADLFRRWLLRQDAAFALIDEGGGGEAGGLFLVDPGKTPERRVQIFGDQTFCTLRFDIGPDEAPPLVTYLRTDDRLRPARREEIAPNVLAQTLLGPRKPRFHSAHERLMAITEIQGLFSALRTRAAAIADTLHRDADGFPAGFDLHAV